MRVLVPAITAAAFALAGCSYPPYTAVRAPEAGAAPASPAGVVHDSETIEGARGTHLFLQHWRPREGVRASLMIVHGLKDHGSRYAALAERLAARGVAVYAFDLRGHGRSEGVRVWVDEFDDYVADVDTAVKLMREREPGAPAFVFGHSMGGGIVTLWSITRRPDVKGLILSGAALALDVPTVKVGGTRAVAALSPNAGVFQLELKDFSRDPAVVEEGGKDPLVYQKGAPAHLAVELIGGVRTIGERMEDVTLPLLILHGEADKVTPPAGSKALEQRARSTDKTLKLYPGLYHDLLHEPEKEQVMKDIEAWIDARVPAAGAAPPAPAAAP